MSTVLPVTLCLLAWWVGTGLVLLLNKTPDDISGRKLLVSVLVAVLAFVVILQGRDTATFSSACLAFASAIVIWGWLEYLHYSGRLVGPGVNACPPDLSTWHRFRRALHAMFYHELAMAVCGLVLLFVCWGATNKTALYTYGVLWLMRVSAELNVFFGVAFLPEDWLPSKLRYLMSYRKVQRISWFFPVSVFVAILFCVALFAQVPSNANDVFTHTSNLLVATLLLLAIIEHILLVLPIKGTSLWSWAHGSAA